MYWLVVPLLIAGLSHQAFSLGSCNPTSLKACERIGCENRYLELIDSTYPDYNFSNKLSEGYCYGISALNYACSVLCDFQQFGPKMSPLEIGAELRKLSEGQPAVFRGCLSLTDCTLTYSPYFSEAFKAAAEKPQLKQFEPVNVITRPTINFRRVRPGLTKTPEVLSDVMERIKTGNVAPLFIRKRDGVGHLIVVTNYSINKVTGLITLFTRDPNFPREIITYVCQSMIGYCTSKRAGDVGLGDQWFPARGVQYSLFLFYKQNAQTICNLKQLSESKKENVGQKIDSGEKKPILTDDVVEPRSRPNQTQILDHSSR